MQAARILGIDRRTLYRRDDRKARANNASTQGNADA
jgi:hypothetical protein